jgi:P-type Cu2+ transporter
MQRTLEPTAVIPARVQRPCSHCGLPTMCKENDPRVFCCTGCMGAYALIHEMGLESYYDLKANSPSAQIPAANARDGLLNDLDAAGVVVQPLSDGLCSVRLSVDGVHCAACSWLIERVRPSIRGLHHAQVRMSDQTIELIYDPEQTSPAHVSKRLGRLGYSLSPWISEELDARSFVQLQREHWMGIALASFFAANAMWIGVALYAGEATGISATHEYFLRWVGTLLAIMAAVFPGRIFYRTALQAIRTKTPHVDIPVALSLTIGVIGGVIGAILGTGQVYFDSLASLILLLRIGRYIQFRAQYRTSMSVVQLLRLNASVASRVESDGTQTKLPAYRLQKNDLVSVRASETIPADGMIESVESSEGASLIDVSLINGESTPLQARAGDPVIGGTLNLSVPIAVRVSAAGEASRVGKLLELVRTATTHRTPWIQAADRIGKWFVIVVLVIALFAFATWSMIDSVSAATQHTMALLTIACPCALALAAPLVLTVALGRAARQQIWIRDGNCLERLSVPGTLWMDKTGTLTYGRMRVLQWHGDSKWLRYASALEKSVQHPVALAIRDFVAPNPTVDSETISETNTHLRLSSNGAIGSVDGFQVCVGNESWLKQNRVLVQGDWISLQEQSLSRGETVVWVAIDGNLVGMFSLGDPLREDAITTLQSIAAQGWKLAIASGDRQEIVDRIALELNRHSITLIASLGNQTPENKLECIRTCKLKNVGTCAMVGDGVNDAAALAAADVGIAIRGGSDQSLRAAPIYIGNQRFDSVLQLMEASKSVVRGIRRCFVASLLYNSVTIALAMFGWIHPLIAAILMPISGITVLAMALTARSFPTSNLRSGTKRL